MTRPHPTTNQASKRSRERRKEVRKGGKNKEPRKLRTNKLVRKGKSLSLVLIVVETVCFANNNFVEDSEFTMDLLKF